MCQTPSAPIASRQPVNWLAARIVLASAGAYSASISTFCAGVNGADGLKLAEWPEKAQGVLPRPDLRIEIEPLEGDSRRVLLTAFTPRGLELMA